MGGGGGGDEAAVDPDNTNLFVGNLSKDGSVTMQEMREAFVTAGARVSDIVEVRTYGGSIDHSMSLLSINEVRWRKRTCGVWLMVCSRC